MKRSGFALWKLLVSSAGLLLICVWCWWPIRSPSGPAPRYDCLNTLKQIGFSLAQYGQDFDDRLPQIAGAAHPTLENPYGWADALYPYIK